MHDTSHTILLLCRLSTVQLPNLRKLLADIHRLSTQRYLSAQCHRATSAFYKFIWIHCAAVVRMLESCRLLDVLAAGKDSPTITRTERESQELTSLWFLDVYALLLGSKYSAANF